MAINKDIIVDLLNFLIEEHRDLSWKMVTGYHNGVDISIYEVLVFEIKSNKTIAKIAFNGFNGNVINLQQACLKDKKATHIVDAILDINNTISKMVS
jgi:RNA binding exosome subunit